MASKQDPRSEPALQAETLDPRESLSTEASPLVPALTILCHPDVSRIGEVSRLALLAVTAACPLSRLDPVFSRANASRGEPLADPFVSRKPVWLRYRDGALGVEAPPEATSVAVEGEPLQGRRAFTDEELLRGVVLELGRRVVLLLHVLPREPAHGPSLGLVGENPAMERVRQDVLRVADLPVSVLVRGETGTGKELVARALHEASPRRERPCVCVNMATISESVAASELFGHARGAFTGAVADHPGLFVRADGGTLFLDEVGEASASVQVMLLRVLETSEVLAVGARAGRKVDVRLVAATDARLEQDVDRGEFAAPLLHRLAGYELVLPPLRARRDDVARLLVHFLREELQLIGEASRLAPAAPDASPWLPASLVARFVRYDWPGNVRQLRNLARQLVISSRGLPKLRVDDAVERTLSAVRTRAPADRAASAVSAEPTSPAAGTSPAGDESAGGRRPSTLSDEELVAALREHGWKRGPTAEALGISISSLYTLIERCALLRKAKDVTREELVAAKERTGGDLAKMSTALEVSVRGLQLRLRELDLV